jgi:hypothetical protein
MIGGRRQAEPGKLDAAIAANLEELGYGGEMTLGDAIELKRGYDLPG